MRVRGRVEEVAHLGYLLLLLGFAAMPPLIASRRPPGGQDGPVQAPLAVAVLGRVLPGALAAGLLWDVLGHASGWWAFHPGLDVRMWGLPVEEYAFMALCVVSVVLATLGFERRREAERRQEEEGT